MKKMIYVSIVGYTLSSLQELGGKKPQITFHLTVLNDHRSNIWYAAKLRNSVVCQKKE